MAAELGVEIVVQNVEGAGGTVAADQVANAEPDGYTVLMHHIGMSTAPTLYPNLEYDPLTSFRTIGLVTEVPMTIIGGTEFISLHLVRTLLRDRFHLQAHRESREFP